MQLSTLLQATIVAVLASSALARPQTPDCTVCSDANKDCGVPKAAAFIPAAKTTTRKGWTITWKPKTENVYISADDSSNYVQLNNQNPKVGGKDAVVQVVYKDFGNTSNPKYLVKAGTECLVAPIPVYKAAMISEVDVYEK